MDSAGPTVVDTVVGIRQLVGLFDNLPNQPPSLYLDIEGIKLSRYGSISIIQVFLRPRNQTYVIDIHTLGQLAFTTPSASGTTYKMVLESEHIQQVFFDIRNDSDALYHHFFVHLAGIHGIQLLELATRNFSRRNLSSLARCIERDAQLSMSEAIEWQRVKNKGRMLFAPERGGSYDVFNNRPLSEDIIKYCAQDVQLLPRLWQICHTKLERRWKAKVKAAVKDRVNVCLQADYTRAGRDKAMAHRGWA